MKKSFQGKKLPRGQNSSSTANMKSKVIEKEGNERRH
jgi:hypothetical protein